VSGKIDHKEEIFIESPIVDLGDNTVWNKERGVLLRERYPIALTRHEIILIKLLVDNAEQICSNDAMLHHFYLQGIDLDEKNIRNLVFKLRKKLPPRAIESIYGMGYKLLPVR
jgi:two-component system OmpR family response regulator